MPPPKYKPLDLIKITDNKFIINLVKYADAFFLVYFINYRSLSNKYRARRTMYNVLFNSHLLIYKYIFYVTVSVGNLKMF